MKKIRLIKMYILPIWVLSCILLLACVDDFEDANPPRLLDAPAVNSLSISDTLVDGGGDLSLSINVTDAPGGVDSIGIAAQDDNGIERGTSTVDTPLTLQTSGQFTMTYTAPSDYTGEVTISVAVFDRQFDEDGDLVRKSSVPQTVEITVN